MKKFNFSLIFAKATTLLVLVSTSTWAALQINVRDEGSGDAQWAKPRIFITNTGNATSTISSVRYYFEKVAGKTPALEVWDAGGAPGFIVDAGSQYYAEINLGGIQIPAGQSLRWGNGILFGLHNTDWSSWNKTTPTSVTVQSSDQVLPPPGNPNNDQVINSIGSNCWENYAVLANNSIQLQDRTQILGSVGASGPIQLGADADVTQGSIFATGIVNLLDRVFVGGDVRSTHAINQGTSVQITGAVAAYAPSVPTCSVNPPSGNAVGGTTNIYVAQWQTLEIPPGTYGNVDVDYNGTLVLSAGQYVFGTLTINEDAGIRLTSGNLPVKVLTVNPFNFKDRSRITMDGQEAARRLQITSVSSAISSVGYDTRLKGTYAAPSGTIHLKDRSSIIGGVVAATVVGSYDAQITWAPRLATINLPPTPVLNTVYVVPRGSTVLTPSHLTILDPDTPLDQLVLTYKIQGMGAYLTRNGVTINPGSTISLAEIAANQISVVNQWPQIFGDLLWFEVTDGVNTVSFKVDVTLIH